MPLHGLTSMEAGTWNKLCLTPVFLQKQDILDLFSSILYECVTQENPEMLPTYIAIDQVGNSCFCWKQLFFPLFGGHTVAIPCAFPEEWGQGLRSHLLVSFLLQFPLPGRDEAGEAGDVRDLWAVADEAGAGILQFPEPPGEDEQESNPRALHELGIPASDEVRHR